MGEHNKNSFYCDLIDVLKDIDCDLKGIIKELKKLNEKFDYDCYYANNSNECSKCE